MGVGWGVLPAWPQPSPQVTSWHTLTVYHLLRWAQALHSGVTLFLGGMAAGLPPKNIYNSRNVDGFPVAWRECPAALGGWYCLLLEHFREMTPLVPFLGWKCLIYTQLSES